MKYLSLAIFIACSGCIHTAYVVAFDKSDAGKVQVRARNQPAAEKVAKEYCKTEAVDLLKFEKKIYSFQCVPNRGTAALKSN